MTWYKIETFWEYAAFIYCEINFKFIKIVYLLNVL